MARTVYSRQGLKLLQYFIFIEKPRAFAAFFGEDVFQNTHMVNAETVKTQVFIQSFEVTFRPD